MATKAPPQVQFRDASWQQHEGNHHHDKHNDRHNHQQQYYGEQSRLLFEEQAPFARSSLIMTTKSTTTPTRTTLMAPQSTRATTIGTRSSTSSYIPARTSTRLTAAVTRSSSSPRSLTAGYADFAHSWRAVRIFLVHATLYYVIAVIGMSSIVQNWSWIDSFYFATVLFTTIGFGDLSPSNDSARILTIFLGLYGIAILGLFIGIAGEALIQAHTQAIERLRNEFQRAVIQELEKDYQEDELYDDLSAEESMRSELPQQQPDSNQDDVERPTLRRKYLIDPVLSVLLMEVPLVVIVFASAVLIGRNEGWNVLDSIYFAVIAGTTVGLGDFAPHHVSTRLLCCFFLPLCVAVVGTILARIASAFMTHKVKLAEMDYFQRSLTPHDLILLDTDKNGVVDKAEFLTYVLVTLQKVSKEDIDAIMKVFDQFDATGDGVLNIEDAQLSERMHRSFTRASIARRVPLASSRTRNGGLQGNRRKSMRLSDVFRSFVSRDGNYSWEATQQKSATLFRAPSES